MAKKDTKKKVGSFEIPESGITDSFKQLGAGRTIILGLQHTFAMFGATVLVPILTGLNISTTLLMAGIGTLLFHLITKGKIPAFLGSSFAFLGGYATVKGMAPEGVTEAQMLPYACLGVAVAGLLYIVLAALFKIFGANRVMKFFPPIVIGPIIIAIGLILSPSAIDNCSQNWLLAVIALFVIIACNIWGKGMVKIVPIIIGIVASYVVAVCMGEVDFTAVKEAAWVGLPIYKDALITNAFKDSNLALTSIIAIVPIAIATMMEHIGDISAISATTGKNFIADPGLHRTLIGDGVATTLASCFGGPANTTYGENTGVLALTKVYDPKVVRIAAIFAIVLSFSPKFSAIISTIPTAVIGGVSLMLYGMISAIGVRNIVENQVDFSKTRNVIIAAIILVTALGIQYSTNGGITFTIGSATITLTGLAVAAILGIIVNAILPGNDYKFVKEEAAEAKE